MKGSFIIIASLMLLLLGSGFKAWADESQQKTTQGIKALNEGNVTQGGRLLKEAVELNPSNTKALMFLGDYYMKLEKFDEAEDLYIRALSIEDDSSEINLRMARVKFNTGQFDDAIEILTPLLKVYENNVEIFYMLGESYRQKNVFDKAETSLRTASIIAPQNIKVRESLGKLYYQSRLYHKAQEELEAILSIPGISIEKARETEEILKEIAAKGKDAKLWHLIIPVLVILIIVPSYFVLKKHKLEHPVDPEEYFDE